MAKLSKLQLIEEVANELNVPKAHVATILTTALNAISKSVAHGNSINLGNSFGTFKSVITKPTLKYIPVTNKEIEIPAKQVIRFVPSVSLKSFVNQ